MTAPPTRNSSPSVSARRSSSLSSAKSRRMSLSPSAAISHPGTDAGVDENVPAPERRRRMGEQVQAQAHELRAEYGLGKRWRCADPERRTDAVLHTCIFRHSGNIIGEIRREPGRWRGDRLLQLAGTEACQPGVELRQRVTGFL